MLTISVKNFGPIAEGSVDLKPLTIFVGPSNTGKSYMATAVYAIARARSQTGNEVTFHDDAVSVSLTNFPYGMGNEMPEDLLLALPELQAFRDKHLETGTLSPDVKFSQLPEGIRLWLDKEIVQRLYLLHTSAIQQIRFFHGEPSRFVKTGSKIEGFSLSIRQPAPLLNLEARLSEDSPFIPEFDISDISLPIRAIDHVLRRGISPELNRMYLGSETILVDLVVGEIFNKLPARSYFLPAARSGMVQGHKVLSAALVRQSSQIGIRELNISMLPGISAEFLSHLIAFDRRMLLLESKGALDLATHFIETHVLQGKIDLDQSAGLPFPNIAYETTEGNFTIEHTSSMVLELAPLVLFLKYLVRPGDLLIFEEPESHLHPAAQRQLARGIVRLVNAGVRVLITTHSDIIISQINNLLALPQASPELIDSSGLEPEDFLQPDQVGAYLFRYSQELSGCETVPLEIDSDTGIDEDEFASVFEAIYDESIALQRDRN